MMENYTLFIDACVREQSRTRSLAQRYLSHIRGPVRIHDLRREPLPALTEQTLAKRMELTARGDYEDPMFACAREFANAQRIVIAAPYWDLTFPAVLKQYLEQITVSGLTFVYENGVPRGLCKAKQLVLLTTAGGPIFADFGFVYLKTLAQKFYGIDDVRSFRAEGLDIAGADVHKILENALRQIDEAFNA